MKYKNEILFYVVIGVCTTCWRDRKVDQFFKSYIIQHLILMIKVNLLKIISKKFNSDIYNGEIILRETKKTNRMCSRK